MNEFVVRFQQIKNTKVIDNVCFRVDKFKYKKIKGYVKSQLKGVHKEMKPKYSSV